MLRCQLCEQLNNSTNQLTKILSSNKPGKRVQWLGIGEGQGLLIIWHAWSGQVGGCCAVQASTSSVCKCAVCVCVAVHVSLLSRLSGADDELCLEEKLAFLSKLIFYFF